MNITHKPNLKSVIKDIKSRPLRFINDYFKSLINKVVRDFFPNLNSEDLDILQTLTFYTVELISNKYGFKNTEIYYEQWTQNNYRDIKGTILLLLPFIDDKQEGYLLKKMQDLNQLLYAFPNKKSIPKNISELVREDILSSHFEYGNMGIGLMPNANSSDTILDLFYQNEKLIYLIIYHNFMGLIQTLEMMNGKSYVNWINIVPLNLQNYVESDIFKSTNVPNDLATLKLRIEQSFNLTNYNGLSYGDFYNVLRIKYYEEAKKIKWLFFPYEFGSSKIYLINGLNQMLNLSKLINEPNILWDLLEPFEQIYFINKLKDLYNGLQSGNSKTGNLDVDFEIVKYLIIYFYNNYKSANLLDPIFGKFKLGSEFEVSETVVEDFDKKDLDKMKKIEQSDILTALKIISEQNPSDLWNYLYDVLDQLKNSPYGKFLLIESKKNPDKYKLNNKYYYEPFNNLVKKTPEYSQNVKDKLNLKNIYNIAKAISHSNPKDWILLDRHYISLSSEQKIDFFSKITLIKKPDEWINLQSNLKKQYIGINYDYTSVINQMINAFSNIYKVLVFEELAVSGLLSKFEPNLKITNKLYLPKDFGPRKDRLKELFAENFKKNSKEWLDSYYYLTNKKYSKLEKMRLDKKVFIPNDKYDEVSYFEAISKDQEWSVFYAMDWICQISFFQHYIFHQVMYVTGATGQGKSTQIPKLLLYALKAIDYKSDGKVVCTQPRQIPTVNNATRIAEELGVPIEKVSNNSPYKIRTSNYYVQYKHKTGSHTNSNNKHSYLRIVTDGTLFQELKFNLTLLNKRKTDTLDQFVNKNSWDIVIVDEAHEHNVNMDLIISLTKQACFYNNRIRLIIVSATMDDDEPTYRRYFYDLNEKLMFPIKNFVYNPFDKTTHVFEPMLMDRRYHISPPGETTQYRVDEYYLDNDPLVYTTNGRIDEKNSSYLAQELGYKRIIEICSKTSTGEILFFANGQGEIIKAVEELNKIMPPGNIALPYFSEMNDTYKDIIAKINIKISQIKNKRENIHKEWGPNFIIDSSVPTGIYKRAVIVATNVAEASVTIPGLTYVVDNGYSKVVSFLPELDLSSLIVEKISEASRLQRKGRVGRIGDGTVYYLYKRDARRTIKPKYAITQQQMATVLLDILGEKTISDINFDDYLNYGKLIVSDKINPYLPNLLELPIETDLELQNTYTVKSGLYQIYQQNYKINMPQDQKNILFILNIIDGKINTKVSNEFMAFDTGQLFDNILDASGNFLLIHYFEKLIQRNVLNQIIMHNNKKQQTIDLINFRFILTYLQNKNLIINLDRRTYNDLIDYSNIKNIRGVKSELGTKALYLSTQFDMSITDAITLISAAGFNCIEEVYELFLLLKQFEPKYDLSKIANIPIISWEQFKTLYPDTKSDLLFLFEIIQKLKKQFNNLLAFNVNKSSTQVMIQTKMDELLTEFKSLSKTYNEPPTTFDGKIWNKLINLKNKNAMNEYVKALLTDSSIQNIIINDIKRHEKDIELWAYNNYLNPVMILKFLTKLGEFGLTKNNIIEYEPIKWAKEMTSSFTKQLNTYTIDEKIIRSFIFGNPSNFTIESKDDEYITLINLLPYEFTLGKNVKSRLTSPETLSNLSKHLIFYYKYDADNYEKDGTVNLKFLNKIDASWLIPASPNLINPFRMNEIKLFYYGENDKKLEIYSSHNYKMLIREIINSWGTNILIWASKETPLLYLYYQNIYKDLSRFINQM